MCLLKIKDKTFRQQVSGGRYDSLSCDTCVIAVAWNWTHPTSEVHLNNLISSTDMRKPTSYREYHTRKKGTSS